MKTLIRVLMVLLVLGMIGFVAAVGTWMMIGRTPEEVKIPDVSGKAFETAFDILHRLGLEIDKKEKFDNGKREGMVLSQFPKPGAMARKKRTVELTVSKGPQWIRVPNIVQMDWVLAKNLLRQTGREIYQHGGLNIGNISRMYSESVSRNIVIAQTPAAGRVVPKNTPVDILVSLGQRPRVFFMPDLIGKNFENATRTGDKLKLHLKQILRREDENQIPGTVIEQTPRAGIRIEEGSPYTITISIARTASQNEDERYLPFQYLVPPGEEPYRVKIMVKDMDGERQVYDDIAESASPIYTSFKIRGRAKVTVFLDGLPQAPRYYDVN